MEVHAACKYVRAGQTFERKLCSVCTTTYWLYLWSYTAVLHSVQYKVYNVHLRVNLLLHVVVLILNSYLNCSLAGFFVHGGSCSVYQVLAVFYTLAVVVAYDVAHRGILNVALYSQ